MPESFTKTDLRNKFVHVFQDVLKLPVAGITSKHDYPRVSVPPGTPHIFSLGEWSPGDGKTRYRVEDMKTGRNVTAQLSLQEMRHFLDGILVGRELIQPERGE